MTDDYDAEADSWGSWRVAIDALRERRLTQSEEENDRDDWAAALDLLAQLSQKLKS